MSDKILVDHGICGICNRDKYGVVIRSANHSILLCNDCLQKIYEAWLNDDIDLLNAIGSDVEVDSRSMPDSEIIIKYTDCYICGKQINTVKLSYGHDYTSIDPSYVCHDCIRKLYYSWVEGNFEVVDSTFGAKKVPE